MSHDPGWILAQSNVREFETVVFDALASLMRATLAGLPANPDGYALFESPGLRAILSTNPHARVFRSAIGAARCEPAELREANRFFAAHNVPARFRVPPDGLTPARARLLSELGLIHTGFHAVLFAPIESLAIEASGDSPSIAIERITDPDRYETFLDVQIRGWGIPDWAVESVKQIRRPWRTAPGHHAYLATLNGQPAAHAMTYERSTTATRFPSAARAHASSLPALPLPRTRTSYSSILAMTRSLFMPIIVAVPIRIEKG
jgi:hypothetical protein